MADDVPNPHAMTDAERADLAAQFADLGIKLAMHTAAMESAGYSRGEALRLTVGFQAAFMENSE